jgi:hypothetical protein
MQWICIKTRTGDFELSYYLSIIKTERALQQCKICYDAFEEVHDCDQHSTDLSCLIKKVFAKIKEIRPEYYLVSGEHYANIQATDLPKCHFCRRELSQNILTLALYRTKEPVQIRLT